MNQTVGFSLNRVRTMQRLARNYKTFSSLRNIVHIESRLGACYEEPGVFRAALLRPNVQRAPGGPIECRVTRDVSRCNNVKRLKNNSNWRGRSR
jgi:hypothetical protein